MNKPIYETHSTYYDNGLYDTRVGKVLEKECAEGWEPFQILPDPDRTTAGQIWFKRLKVEKQQAANVIYLDEPLPSEEKLTKELE